MTKGHAPVGREVLQSEGQAILDLAAALGDRFEEACEWILKSEGRVLCCGVGKSGHIARKTSGTLSSTGTPSAFLHAAEAVHGDLGMVTRHDIVLLYSHSGETDEIVKLFPAIHAIGARTILISGREPSSASRQAQLTLLTEVREEACPHNLAPTTSTTAMLALSDALAVAVMSARGFGREDFARFHPAGALGRRLLLTVADVMRQGEDLPIVGLEASLIEVLQTITQVGAGAACVVEEGRLMGFISDGDLRRHFLAGTASESVRARDLMKVEVTTITGDLLAVEALEIFQNHPIRFGEMPVVDSAGRLLGLLMLKDLLRSGIL